MIAKIKALLAEIPENTYNVPHVGKATYAFDTADNLLMLRLADGKTLVFKCDYTGRCETGCGIIGESAERAGDGFNYRVFNIVNLFAKMRRLTVKDVEAFGEWWIKLKDRHDAKRELAKLHELAQYLGYKVVKK